MELGIVLFALGIWVAATLVGLALVALVVVSLPETYFLDPEAGRSSSSGPAGATARRIVRNVCGVVLVVVGLLLSIPGIPGQGLLTILAGVILLDFPGRHRLARALARRRGVLATLNGLRARFGRPPLAGPTAEPEKPSRHC
jgi:hypothetical protein